MRDGLRDEALPAALNTQEHDTLRGLESIASGGRAQAALSLLQPSLQVLHPADLIHFRGGFEIFQNLAAPDDLGLLLRDDDRRLGIEGLVLT